MKLAIVGKGGSGKSTVSWLYSNYLAQQDNAVLAIDADYNLDLLHNFHLSKNDVPHFINGAEKDFYSFLGLSEKDYYVDIPTKNNLSKFTLSPADWFTQKYSFSVAGTENVRLMVTGMVPQDMLYGHRCGHAYISSLKYYLPLLTCKPNEQVIIDSVAGTDLVSYGMFLGCDAIAVVVEETPHSVGVYEQISNIADEFSIPVFIVLNKFRNTGRIAEFIAKHQERIIGQIPFDDSIVDYDFSKLSTEVKQSLKDMQVNLSSYSFDASDQWQRHVTWRQRYDAQLKESQKKDFQFLEG